MYIPRAFYSSQIVTKFFFYFSRLSESSSSDGSCRSLWVGNVNPELVSERHLLQLFSRCGHVDNVRILPKRFCAFVNFEKADSAAIALEKLQVHVTLKFHLCDNLSLEDLSALCLFFFFSFWSKGIFPVQCKKNKLSLGKKKHFFCNCALPFFLDGKGI